MKFHNKYWILNQNQKQTVDTRRKIHGERGLERRVFSLATPEMTSKAKCQVWSPNESSGTPRLLRQSTHRRRRLKRDVSCSCKNNYLGNHFVCNRCILRYQHGVTTRNVSNTPIHDLHGLVVSLARLSSRVCQRWQQNMAVQEFAIIRRSTTTLSEELKSKWQRTSRHVL